VYVALALSRPRIVRVAVQIRIVPLPNSNGRQVAWT
jgi:hypothetical protein